MAVITLSRQSGSDGNKVAEILCRRLGYEYFDKNLMAKLAQEIGISPATVKDVSVDKHQAKSFWERAFSNTQSPFTDPSSWTFTAREDAREEMSVQQVRTLINVAYEKGNVVIVGRGGMVALAGKPDVLHVRVVAPEETRIRRWQAREKLAYEDAVDKVHDRDAAHNDFVKRFFDADVTDPSLFDLVISTEKLTPEVAADIVVKAVNALKVPA